MDDADLRLDGNAAAGTLTAIFGVEMTVNWSTCAGCGADHPLGALVAYIHGMGTILRCPDCGGVQVRIAQLPDGYRIDLRGVRTLRLAVAGAA